MASLIFNWELVGAELRILKQSYQVLNDVLSACFYMVRSTSHTNPSRKRSLENALKTGI